MALRHAFRARISQHAYVVEIGAELQGRNKFDNETAPLESACYSSQHCNISQLEILFSAILD